MASLLKNLLGNGSQDQALAEEMRSVLQEMQQERARYETLVAGVRTSIERLQELGEPIAQANNDVDDVGNRLREVEQRLAAIVQLSTHVEGLNDRAEQLAQNQEAAESRIAGTIEDSQRVRSIMEDLAQKVDLAVGLKEQLASFLEVEKPFQQLRGEAESLRGQVEGTGDQLARLREQHDRLLDAHKTAMSKMEALDRRRDELGRDLQDKERRVVNVEQSVRGMDGVQHTVDEVRREMQTLKATADLVGQKMAGLEAQREAVDRALAQADNLDRAMRQIDAGVRQQLENEKTLAVLQDQLGAVRSVHDEVVERSSAISQLQREIDSRTEAGRQELAAVTDETRKTVERFDFERRGMESVTQRVADLRAAVSDCESRFKNVGEAARLVGELHSQTEALTSRLQAFSTEAAQIDSEIVKLSALRRDLDNAGAVAREASAHMAQIEQARPAVTAALADLQQLGSTHTSVRDALEQTQVAHGEIHRMRESQSGTHTWLTSVESSVGELKEHVSGLEAMAPTVEFVQQQTQRIGESMVAIESRREFIEDLQRRLVHLESMGTELDERGRQLQVRMDAAEQRFVALSAHAEDAERMTMTVASVSSSLNEAGREAEDIKKKVTAIAARSESVESLAERTQSMRKELEQRHRALAEAGKELERTSTVRQDAAGTAQQLDELAKKLTASLSAADKRVTRVGELSEQLESRAENLLAVEKRLDEFENRIAKWNCVDQDVARSLEQIAARQGTVEAVKADLDRLFEMADRTTTHVREITSAHQDIESSRELLGEVMGGLSEVREIVSSLDERKRQMTRAEERLARADGLLVDVRSSLEALQSQKAIVDQAVEKAGSLQFLLKQAEAAIEGLREERRVSAVVRSAAALDDDDEDEAQAA